MVDSDDWVDEDALKKVLNTLRYMVEHEKNLDMLLANFVYDKQGAKHKKVMKYKNIFPVKHITHWEGYVHFRKSQYIFDAFRDLPHTDAPGMWINTARTYLLCG